ncbi:hypothetical protein Tco_0745242 [Tanacetum coccineum]
MEASEGRAQAWSWRRTLVEIFVKEVQKDKEYFLAKLYDVDIQGGEGQWRYKETAELAADSPSKAFYLDTAAKSECTCQAHWDKHHIIAVTLEPNVPSVTKQTYQQQWGMPDCWQYWLISRIAGDQVWLVPRDFAGIALCRVAHSIQYSVMFKMRTVSWVEHSKLSIWHVGLLILLAHWLAAGASAFSCCWHAGLLILLADRLADAAAGTSMRGHQSGWLGSG